eukprot:TRINITY_DN16138_c0_g1_i2.p1 TRINITY_DN16138_c0_g1~~TRINITY_DN16138_c0_g1_i2.p1  ORF type:complete len:615 (+),score=63.57 TRINITY_DN16138_c0_g1_i2:47-1846(+)
MSHAHRFRSAVPILFCVWLPQFPILSQGSSLEEGGSLRCPCASAKDLQASGRPVPMGYDPKFGAGCQAHTNSPDNISCGNRCNDHWCYIKDSKSCSLPMHQSTLIPGRFFSYETCGFFDYFTSARLLEVLKQTTVKVLRLSNSGGWKGIYCSQPNICTGALSYMLDKVLDNYVGGREYIGTISDVHVTGTARAPGDALFPPEVMSQVYRDHPPATIDKVGFDEICLYGTGMGYFDICATANTMFPRRLLRSHFIEVYIEPIILVAPFQQETPTLWTHLGAFMSPFHIGLWLLYAGTLVAIALAIIAQEWCKDGSLEDVPFQQACRSALFQSFGSVVGASEINATSFGSNVVKMALGLLVLFGTTAYTANLASLLVVKNTWAPTISSIADVKRLGAKVCAQGSQANRLVNDGVLGRGSIVEFAKRTDLLPGIEAGACMAAVMMKEDFEQQTSNGSFCNFRMVGTELAANRMGIAVSEKVFFALQYAFLSAGDDGLWMLATQKNRPDETCSTRANTASDDDGALTALDMFGPFVVTAILILFGLSTSALAKFRRQPEAAKDPSEEVSGQSSEGNLAAMAAQLAALTSQVSAMNDKMVAMTV